MRCRECHKLIVDVYYSYKEGMNLCKSCMMEALGEEYIYYEHFLGGQIKK